MGCQVTPRLPVGRKQASSSPCIALEVTHVNLNTLFNYSAWREVIINTQLCLLSACFFGCSWTYIFVFFQFAGLSRQQIPWAHRRYKCFVLVFASEVIQTVINLFTFLFKKVVYLEATISVPLQIHSCLLNLQVISMATAVIILNTRRPCSKHSNSSCPLELMRQTSKE